MKKEFIILGAIIIAAALYLALHETDRTHYQLPDLTPLAASDIDRIEIQKGDEEALKLRRAGSQWVVGEAEYKADADRAGDLADVIAGLTLTALVSESKNYERYGLPAEERISVTAADGDTVVRRFEIGEAAATHRHTYIKLAQDPNVYHARGNFRGQFDQTLDGLRDKSVLSFQTEAISEVTVFWDGAEYYARRQEPQQAPEVSTTAENTDDTSAAEPPAAEAQPVWEDKNGHPLAADSIRNMITPLSQLKCSGYIYDRKKADFSDPVMEIRLNGMETFSLRIFERTDDVGDYPAVSSQNDSAFRLPAYRLDNFEKNVKEAFPAAAAQKKDAPAQ